MNFFNPSAGPLANDMAALNTLCRAIISARPALYDATTLDIPWRDVPKPQTPAKLKIGMLSEDPVFPLHPPVKRALAEAAKQLQSHGHTIVPIPPSRGHVADALAVAFGFFGLDNTTGKAHIEASGEPLVASVKQAMSCFGEFHSDFLADLVDLEGVPLVAALNAKRELIADDWRAIWKEEGLDGVIAPPAQSTAVRHDTWGLPPYTLVWNVLDVSKLLLAIRQDDG
jgi:amidase